jgi:hypothetical protein
MIDAGSKNGGNKALHPGEQDDTWKDRNAYVTVRTEAKNPARDELTSWSEDARLESTVAKSLLNLLMMRPMYIERMSYTAIGSRDRLALRRCVVEPMVQAISDVTQAGGKRRAETWLGLQ